MSTAVTMRSYDVARTGANLEEKILTPQRVGSNLLRKLFSAVFDDDPRLEAQPLYAPGLGMSDGQQHDVLYVCTMANNVWAFDAMTANPSGRSRSILAGRFCPVPTPTTRHRRRKSIAGASIISGGSSVRQRWILKQRPSTL